MNANKEFPLNKEENKSQEIQDSKDILKSKTESIKKNSDKDLN